MTDQPEHSSYEQHIDDVLAKVRSAWLRQRTVSSQTLPALLSRWEMSNLLGFLAVEVNRSWPDLHEDFVVNVTPNQGFREEYIPTGDDGFLLFLHLSTLSHALSGMGSWAGIRRMAGALVQGDRLLTLRQAKAVEKCTAALEAWRRISRRRRKGEARPAYEDRLQGPIAKEEAQVVRYLVLGLREHEHGFSKLKSKGVASCMRTMRDNASPYWLLSELAKLAEVWPNASVEALKAAHKAQRKKAPSGEVRAPVNR